jgi:hypothetical protein
MPAESITVGEMIAEWRSRMRRDRRRACPRPAAPPSPAVPVPEAEARRRAGRPPHARGKRRAGSSKYYGVSLIKLSGRWEARVQSGGVTRRGGTHATEEAAARAADRVSRELFGDRAILNFPEGEAT